MTFSYTNKKYDSWNNITLTWSMVNSCPSFNMWTWWKLFRIISFNFSFEARIVNTISDDRGNFFVERYHYIFFSASQLCKLTCISLDTQDVFVTSDDVTDGTQCSYDVPDHVCVRGKCVVSVDIF